MAINSDSSNISNQVSNIKQSATPSGTEGSHPPSFLQTISLKKASGYFLLVLSFLGWGVFFTLPLFEISVGEAAAFTTGLIIWSEAAFFFGIALLGKEVWGKVKAVLWKCLKQPC
jgi:hypothetical protein